MAIAPSLTSTTGLSPMMAALYDKQLIFREKEELRYEQVAWVKELEGNSGETIHFQAYRPLARVETALTQGSATAHSEYPLLSRRVSVTPREWGATTPIATLFDLTKLDSGLSQQVDIVAEQRNETIDAELAIEVGQRGCFPIRADVDAVHEQHGLGVIATNASVNQFRVATGDDSGLSAALTAGAIICVTAGTNYGYVGRVSSYASSDTTGGLVVLKSGGSTAVNSAAAIFDATSKFTFVDQSALAATDILTNVNIRRARRHLKRNKAPFFDGKTWVALISPEVEYDFMGDTSWLAAKQYSDVQDLYKGEIGMWMNVRFVGTTQPFRETDAGVTDLETGGITHVPIFGRKAFCNAKITGGNQGIVVLQGPDKRDPLNMVTTVGWKSIFRPKSLTGPHCVSILCGATSVAIN